MTDSKAPTHMHAIVCWGELVGSTRRTSFCGMAKKSCQRRMRLRRTNRWNFASWKPPTYIRSRWRTALDCSVQFNRHPIRHRKLESCVSTSNSVTPYRCCYQQQVGERNTCPHETVANFSKLSARKSDSFARTILNA